MPTTVVHKEMCMNPVAKGWCWLRASIVGYEPLLIYGVGFAKCPLIAYWAWLCVNLWHLMQARGVVLLLRAGLDGLCIQYPHASPKAAAHAP